ncbi:putative DNA-binding protein (UPF0251 family) [Desulfitispora alkaliphila]|uniref:DUF134 domain-containing protein n=1 Tax=Desulfitispora alkaliphila TaxID=622674 RepID=UPI003D1C70FF
MPRPRKGRRVCELPKIDHFGPMCNRARGEEPVTMSIEEYETIRLIDLEGYTQEECSINMGVARTTVQGIYNKARKKLAEILINGKVLKVEGGDYKICNGRHQFCLKRQVPGKGHGCRKGIEEVEKS